MKKYKNYYIDGVVFSSKAEIDAHIKEDAKRAYIKALGIFKRRQSLEASIYCSDIAQRMTKLGYTWDEIEKIEAEVFEG